MADEIKIRVATDISDLQTQMEAGADAVEQFSVKASDVLANYAEAMSGSEEQQHAFSEAVKAGQAAGLTWAEAVNEAAAALAEYNATTEEAVAVTNEMAAAEARAAAGANGLGVSARQSAAAGIGILEGRMMSGNRAASAFLSTTLGLGPALQAAFPIIGAIALVDVLVQIGTKLYDVYEKATQAGQEIARAFDESNQKIEAGNDALALSNSRLQDEIDKLEGKPSNGLQTAMLEAINLADRLQSALAADSRELESLLKKREVGYFAAALTATVPTVGLDKNLIQQSDEIESKGYKILQTFKQEMNAAAGDKNKIAEAQKQYFDTINGLYDNEISTLKPKLDHYYELQRENNEKIATMRKLHIPTSIFTSQDVDYSPAVNALERQLRQLEDLKERAKDTAAAGPLEQKKGELEQHKGDESAANKAREKKLRDLEQAYSEEVAIYGKSAAGAAAYWDQYLGTFAQGTTQFEAVLNRVNAAREQLGKKEPAGDLFGKEREELKKLATEARKDADSYQRALDEMAEGEKKLKEAQAKEATDQLSQAHTQTIDTLELSHAKQDEPYQIGTEADAAKQLQNLKAFHEAVQEENEAFLRKEIALAENAGELDKARELQTKLFQVQHDGDMKRLADEEAIQKQQLANFQKVYSAITNDLNESINKMITTTQKPAQIFAQMFDQILSQLATFVEKWIEKKIEMWAEDLVLQATGQAQSKALSLGQIQQAAATAAANTYASVSAVPIVGPVLAPPAAAVAYAAVLAFEAFEQGGIVSGSAGMPVPIMAHAGERVLSAPQTQNFERMVSQSAGGAGSTFNLNYHGQVNAYDRNGMRSTLQSHASDILDIVREGWNSGSLR